MKRHYEKRKKSGNHEMGYNVSETTVLQFKAPSRNGLIMKGSNRYRQKPDHRES
jgi:hypothetical protein